MATNGNDHLEEAEEDYQEESELSESDPSDECEDDRCRGPTLPIWHCVDCDSSYCRYVPLTLR